MRITRLDFPILTTGWTRCPWRPSSRLRLSILFLRLPKMRSNAHWPKSMPSSCCIRPMAILPRISTNMFRCWPIAGCRYSLSSATKSTCRVRRSRRSEPSFPQFDRNGSPPSCCRRQDSFCSEILPVGVSSPCPMRSMKMYFARRDHRISAPSTSARVSHATSRISATTTATGSLTGSAVWVRPAVSRSIFPTSATIAQAGPTFSIVARGPSPLKPEVGSWSAMTRPSTRSAPTCGIIAAGWLFRSTRRCGRWGTSCHRRLRALLRRVLGAGLVRHEAMLNEQAPHDEIYQKFFCGPSAAAVLWQVHQFPAF